MLAHLEKNDPEVFASIIQEIKRQELSLELIASENFTSMSVMEAQGSVLTNKYAEGYPGKRWYNGCEHVDTVETLAIDRAKSLFSAEAANVQPHSGSGANMAVYFALLNPGDSVLAMSLDHGGHLTHGHPMNFSGRFFNFTPYGVSKETEQLDYNEIHELALKSKPRMITAGASAYPRTIDFKKLRDIADAVGAYLMVDMAHIAGLVAAGLHPSPVPYADVVTTTTHKTLRGPRGGLILCREKYLKDINAQVFPGIQGGPLEHVIAAKAVALKEAMSDDFKVYQADVQKNASALAASLQAKNIRIVSGGTDNHLMLVDVSTVGLTGKDAANLLHEAGITVNKNLIPFDQASPFVTSGIRLGTPSLTTRGMKIDEMKEVAGLISETFSHRADKSKIQDVLNKVQALCRRFPLYPEWYKLAVEKSR